jgi:hypothetical protein
VTEVADRGADRPAVALENQDPQAGIEGRGGVREADDSGADDHNVVGAVGGSLDASHANKTEG